MGPRGPGLLGTASYDWPERRVSLAALMRAGLGIETFSHLASGSRSRPSAGSRWRGRLRAHAFSWGTTSLTVRMRAVPLDMQGRVASV